MEQVNAAGMQQPSANRPAILHPSPGQFCCIVPENIRYRRTAKRRHRVDMVYRYCRKQESVSGLESLIREIKRALLAAGLLVIEGKVWRTVYYRFATREEREGKMSTNLVFKECRQSAAMKRYWRYMELKMTIYITELITGLLVIAGLFIWGEEVMKN